MVPIHVQLCGNGTCIGHIKKVKLRRARLVLRLVTTFGGSTHLGILPGHSAWPSLRGQVQWVSAIVSTTAGEETASST